MAKKQHLGFKETQAKIAKKQGVSMKAAGAILASSARKASPKAVKKNPALLNVKRGVKKYGDGGKAKRSGVDSSTTNTTSAQKLNIPSDTNKRYVPSGPTLEPREQNPEIMQKSRPVKMQELPQKRGFRNGGKVTAIAKKKVVKKFGDGGKSQSGDIRKLTAAELMAKQKKNPYLKKAIVKKYKTSAPEGYEFGKTSMDSVAAANMGMPLKHFNVVKKKGIIQGTRKGTSIGDPMDIMRNGGKVTKFGDGGKAKEIKQARYYSKDTVNVPRTDVKKTYVAKGSGNVVARTVRRKPSAGIYGTRLKTTSIDTSGYAKGKPTFKVKQVQGDLVDRERNYNSWDIPRKDVSKTLKSMKKFKKGGKKC